MSQLAMMSGQADSVSESHPAKTGGGLKLVGGWATPLKNMKVNWDDYSQYMGK